MKKFVLEVLYTAFVFISILLAASFLFGSSSLIAWGLYEKFSVNIVFAFLIGVVYFSLLCGIGNAIAKRLNLWL